jgi:hypothetical protein
MAQAASEIVEPHHHGHEREEGDEDADAVVGSDLGGYRQRHHSAEAPDGAQENGAQIQDAQTAQEPRGAILIPQGPAASQDHE